jgi:hypothetical protein
LRLRDFADEVCPQIKFWRKVSERGRNEKTSISGISSSFRCRTDGRLRAILQLAALTRKCRKAGEELLLSCARGCFAGLGIACFIFLRLGAPATRELSGYMVGLFLVAGLKLGFFLWVIRSLAFPLVTSGIGTLRRKGPK